jgi:hypothetical protein
MAGYTLKLSIYTIALKDGEKNDVSFKSLHREITSSNDMSKAEMFSSVKDKFLNSFSEKFIFKLQQNKWIQLQ